MELIERLRSNQELGVDEFSLWCDNSLPHAEKRKSLELFIKEVVPDRSGLPGATDARAARPASLSAQGWARVHRQPPGA